MKHYINFLICLMILGNAGFLNGQSKTNDVGIEGGPGYPLFMPKPGCTHIRYLPLEVFQEYITNTTSIKYSLLRQPSYMKEKEAGWKASPTSFLPEISYTILII